MEEISKTINNLQTYSKSIIIKFDFNPSLKFDVLTEIDPNNADNIAYELAKNEAQKYSAYCCEIKKLRMNGNQTKKYAVLCDLTAEPTNSISLSDINQVPFCDDFEELKKVILYFWVILYN